MVRARIGWTAAIGTLLGGCVATPRFHGPLPVRNQHPAQLTVMHMPPAATSTLAADGWAARTDLAYSSLFLSGSAPGAGPRQSFRMDGEYLRLSPQLRTGLGGGFEVGFEVPFAHTTGGFLDDFLIDYHDAFGFPDQNRDSTPKDDFAVVATNDAGQTVWSVERQGFEVLDIPLWVTWQLASARDGLGVAVRTGFEIPTGDEDRGYGNGEVDYAAGVLLEHHLGGASFYGHLQHTFAGTPGPSSDLGFHFADVTSAGLAAELPLVDELSALCQVEFETSTLRDLDLPVVNRDQVLLWVGARWQCGERWAVELAFGEDLQSHVSPDFTAWLGFTTLPGGKRPWVSP